MSSSARHATRSEPIHPRLLRAYRQTRYRAAGFDIRIGRRVPDALFDRLGASNAALVTAWNPRSRRRPDGWNWRMEQRMRQMLRRFTVLDAEGCLHDWRESMLLVGGAPRKLICIAMRFRQSAIVILRRGLRARLSLV
jgi:Protein of unknown function (DUF3293)